MLDLSTSWPSAGTYNRSSSSLNLPTLRIDHGHTTAFILSPAVLPTDSPCPSVQTPAPAPESSLSVCLTYGILWLTLLPLCRVPAFCCLDPGQTLPPTVLQYLCFWKMRRVIVLSSSSDEMAIIMYHQKSMVRAKECCTGFGVEQSAVSALMMPSRVLT